MEIKNAADHRDLILENTSLTSHSPKSPVSNSAGQTTDSNSATNPSHYPSDIDLNKNSITQDKYLRTFDELLPHEKIVAVLISRGDVMTRKAVLEVAELRDSPEYDEVLAKYTLPMGDPRIIEYSNATADLAYEPTIHNPSSKLIRNALAKEVGVTTRSVSNAYCKFLEREGFVLTSKKNDSRVGKVAQALNKLRDNVSRLIHKT